MPHHPKKKIKANELELQSDTVQVKRVTKVVEGGRNFHFTALVVVGDDNGVVGYGLGKANEVPTAVQKGTDGARKHLVRVHRHRGTLPHTIEAKYKGAKVLLKPATPGTGIIAGGGMRVVLKRAGYTDVLAKSKGSSNPYNVVQATVKALRQLRTPMEVAKARGITLQQVFNG